MRNSRNDVVAAALRVLDAQGLENCSMRRVAAELGVQPSALYHHVPNKQTLLALMADEIVAGVTATLANDNDRAASLGPDRGTAIRGATDADGRRAPVARELCCRLRTAMLAVTDGAEVVATATAFRLGASGVEDQLADLVGTDGARTLLLYTFAQAQATQMQRQAAELGVLLGRGDPGAGASVSGAAGDAARSDLDASFGRGLDVILAGLRVVSFI